MTKSYKATQFWVDMYEKRSNYTTKATKVRKTFQFKKQDLESSMLKRKI